MIERITNMSTNKEYTIEELQEKREKAKKNYELFNELLEAKKKEEKEREEAKLAKERESRKKELDDALERYKMLLRAYMRDYGIYSYSSDDDIFDLFNSKFWNYIT